MNLPTPYPIGTLCVIEGYTGEWAEYNGRGVVIDGAPRYLDGRRYYMTREPARTSFVSSHYETRLRPA